MKKELIDSYIEVLKAILDGKEWEVFVANHWEHPNQDITDFMKAGMNVRVKPEPVTRPWSKPEHVPGPVCWLRLHYASEPAKWDAFIGAVFHDGVGIMGRNCAKLYSWDDISRFGLQYSTDRKTWFACTITE